MGELRTPVALHLLGVEPLEGAIPRLLEENQNGHDLRGMQPGSAPALSLAEFASYQQDLIVGASLQVSAPLGQLESHGIGS
jgi:hypothetical protein